MAVDLIQGPGGRWVPRGLSVALGGGVLAASYLYTASEAFPTLIEEIWVYHVVGAWSILLAVWMWVHKQAVSRRTSSRLLGWGASALLVVAAGIVSETWLYSRYNWSPRLTQGGRYTLHLMRSVGFIVTLWLLAGWAVVTLPEVAWGLGKRWWLRRKGIPATPGGQWIWVFVVLAPLVAPVFPALHTLVKSLGPRWNASLAAQYSRPGLSIWLVGAGGLALVGLLLCERGRGRRIGLILLLVILVVLAWELGLVGVGPSLFTVTGLMWGLIFLLVAMEGLAGHAGRKRKVAGDEAESVRALFHVLRSSIRNWGAGSKRWLIHLTPGLLSGAILLFTYGAFQVEHVTRKNGTFLPWLFPFVGQVGVDYWSVVVFLLLALGVGVPVVAVIPYCWAGRFGEVWNPQALSELRASLLSRWEIVWAVAAPTVYPWALCCVAAAFVSAAILMAGGPNLGKALTPYGTWTTVGLWVAWFALAGCHAFLTLGILRRRILKGMAAIGLAAGTTIVLAAAFFGALLGAGSFGGDNLIQLLLPTVPGLLFLFAVRWAVASAPESLEEAVRGD